MIPAPGPTTRRSCAATAPETGALEKFIKRYLNSRLSRLYYSVSWKFMSEYSLECHGWDHSKYLFTHQVLLVSGVPFE